MKRFGLVFASVMAFVLLGSTPALASDPRGSTQELSTLWTTVLQTPASENPFLGNGCFRFGRTLAPFAAEPVKSCTVGPGTRLFLIGSSIECSSFDGDHGGFGTTPAELRRCAVTTDTQQAPSIAVDHRRLKTQEVITPVLRIVLPADNLFGLPAGSTGRSVAHGWVATDHPLSVGSHTVTITDAGGSVITTKILVRSTCG